MIRLKYRIFTGFLIFLFLSSFLRAQEDHTFYSKTFKTKREYRVYLPINYKKNVNKKYPVIYYFHGWGGRYKWDAYSAGFDKKVRDIDDVRKEPPFVEEWRNYTKTHDAIIVTWDGYDPVYQPGKSEREGIKYGGCIPYDVRRVPHEKDRPIHGWDFRMYFRDLIAHIDSAYRTIPDRQHRAVTGLSMGGFMSFYIGGQSKDYIASASAFCPADNIVLMGPLHKQVVVPILELWRSLKGIPVRLTATAGDWLFYNDMDLKRLWGNAGLSSFEFHLSDFPDHWAGDTEKQLDFHLKNFTINSKRPKNWNYLSPGFPEFRLFGYHVHIERSEPSLTLFDHFADGSIKVLSRAFIPEGPIEQKEKIRVITDIPFNSDYRITAYNLTNGKFSYPEIKKADQNKLAYDLDGGGHFVGVNGGMMKERPLIKIQNNHNQDYLYFEKGKKYSLDFNVVNIGSKDAKNVEIRAFSLHPYIRFANNTLKIDEIKKADVVNVKKAFDFIINKYNVESSVGSILLQVKVNGVAADTQRVIFYSTPASPYASKKDVIILDGRKVDNVPVFSQGPNVVTKTTLSGGRGNGNGILEKGEEALIFIKLTQGLAPNDTNTYHKTYLINAYDDPYVSVNKLQYDEKIRQAGATSISTILSISDSVPNNHEFDFWFKIESLYDEPKSANVWSGYYAHQYDYRRIKITLNK